MRRGLNITWRCVECRRTITSIDLSPSQLGEIEKQKYDKLARVAAHGRDHTITKEVRHPIYRYRPQLDEEDYLDEEEDDHLF